MGLMTEQKKPMDKLDKPLLYSTKRIKDNSLNLSGRQGYHVSNIDRVKEQLIELYTENDKQNIILYIAGWFIVIAFSLAIAIACVCSAALSSAGLFDTIIAFIIFESFVLGPTIFIVIRHRGFRTAVDKGEILMYQFRVKNKWICEYCDDYVIHSKMYLIEFENVYTEVGYSYEYLKPGDLINIYIVRYKSETYFAMPGY